VRDSIHDFSVQILDTLQKKGGNVKTIPPYKPIQHDTSSDSCSSPEKEIDLEIEVPAFLVIDDMQLSMQVSIGKVIRQ